ncbi:MAG: hypothetical protein RLZZ200_2606 [Pseudomonadota bacterium]|jgi:undecaprenyl-diphosphatase
MKAIPRLLALSILGCGLVTAPAAVAGGGPLGIDHRVTYDDSGIWARNVQLKLEYGLLLAEAGIAAWEGGESRLGRTAWQSIDATLVDAVAVELLKKGFSRERPNKTPDPGRWFSGGSNASFPSGEASLSATVVTPFILEYGRDHPAAYALALIPAYDAIARVKTWGHWQSDVIAGAALGAALGYWAHERESPFVLSVMPHGVQLGLSKRW